MSSFPLEQIKALRYELSNHPVYASVKSMDDLTTFMRHHVFSVWDFMSLVKYLQNHIAPTTSPWVPRFNPQVQRFINDIVLEEESDEGLALEDGTPTFISHFNLYVLAMQEVEKNSAQDVEKFIQTVRDDSLQKALTSDIAPKAAQEFMQTTFSFIDTNKPHVVAAAFALGREHIIPQMFRSLLKDMNITREEAEVFHYYLDRHIKLDEDFHGPMSLHLLELLCDGDEIKIQEAHDAAVQAIRARIKFWDGVLEEIQKSN